MPTGYTSTLHDGEQTFPEFALACARNFGALILMRDSAADAKIPDEFPPETSFYDKGLTTARALLEELETMPESVAQERADAEYAEGVAHVAAARAEAEAIRVRYEAMLIEAEAWEPPTADHAGLKRFMIDQLNESIRFDCSTTYLTDPEPQTAQQWVAAQRERAMRDVERYTGERAKEIERAKGRTAWVQALRGSLPELDRA